MSFKERVTLHFILLMFATKYALGERKMLSLEEMIGVGTSKEFEKHFVEKNGNAADLLKMSYRKTNIKEEYLDSVFLQTAGVRDVEDLKSITLNIDEAVDFVNKVINHFKKLPNAGRKEPEGTQAMNAGNEAQENENDSQQKHEL